MADKSQLNLSAQPDGSGYWITRDNERMRVDILPPAHAWRGDVQLEGHRPD
jgi:hypothetical protein